MQEKYLTTAYPNIFFEDNKVGRLKKRLWDASEEEIQAILDDYGIPSDSEIGKPGCYIQTSPRKMVIEKRHKNDIVLVPTAAPRITASITTPAWTRLCVPRSARRCDARRLRRATRSRWRFHRSTTAAIPTITAVCPARS